MHGTILIDGNDRRIAGAPNHFFVSGVHGGNGAGQLQCAVLRNTCAGPVHLHAGHGHDLNSDIDSDGSDNDIACDLTLRDGDRSGLAVIGVVCFADQGAVHGDHNALRQSVTIRRHQRSGVLCFIIRAAGGCGAQVVFQGVVHRKGLDNACALDGQIPGDALVKGNGGLFGSRHGVAVSIRRKRFLRLRPGLDHGDAAGHGIALFGGQVDHRLIAVGHLMSVLSCHFTINVFQLMGDLEFLLFKFSVNGHVGGGHGEGIVRHRHGLGRIARVGDRQGVRYQLIARLGGNGNCDLVVLFRRVLAHVERAALGNIEGDIIARGAGGQDRLGHRRASRLGIGGGKAHLIGTGSQPRDLGGPGSDRRPSRTVRGVLISLCAVQPGDLSVVAIDALHRIQPLGGGGAVLHGDLARNGGALPS